MHASVTLLRFMTSMERRTSVLAGKTVSREVMGKGQSVAWRRGDALTDAAFTPVLVYGEHGDVASV